MQRIPLVAGIGVLEPEHSMGDILIRPITYLKAC